MTLCPRPSHRDEVLYPDEMNHAADVEDRSREPGSHSFKSNLVTRNGHVRRWWAIPLIYALNRYPRPRLTG